MDKRLGITVPIEGQNHYNIAKYSADLKDAGYTDFFSSEVDSFDGFSPLAALGNQLSGIRLGVAVIPVYTRGPALLAMQANAILSLTNCEFVLGLGTSSDTIVKSWNGIDFVDPFKKTRDIVEFLRMAFNGEKIKKDFETFSVTGFKLGSYSPENAGRLKIFLAALRPGMLRLSARVADGVILNWLSFEDVKRCIDVLDSQRKSPLFEVAARIFVMPSRNREQVLSVGRYLINAYLNVPAYREFHRWLDRENKLGQMWEKWEAGDRQGALNSIPEGVVDELIVSGSEEECAAQLNSYRKAGVTAPIVALLPFSDDPLGSLKNLARLLSNSN